jgi:CheY-like chemotaxis protein
MPGAAASDGAVREALQRLYEPPSLASTSLGAELVARGRLRTPEGLYDLLLDAIERLRPPATAPARTPAWRRYRYLRLRYVDCLNHEVIAADLKLSLRQASRVHQDAVGALAGLLLPGSAPTSGHGRAGARPTGPPAEATASRSTASAADPGSRAAELVRASELAIVGRQPPEGAVDLAEVVRGAAETLDRVAAAHGVTLRVDLPTQLPPVGVSRVVLRQILLLLLHHLVRAGGPGLVSVEAAPGGDGVHVALGRAPAPSASADADEPLVAAARELGALQDARVELVPHGARLWLPLGRVKIVLVVDDNPEVGDLFRRMLARSWYHPVHVRSAQRVPQTVHDVRPDVIVLDVVMPGWDGWEVMTTLQVDPATRDVPVVVCSVLPDRELALSLGAANFLAKPVTRPVLLEVLDRLVGEPPARTR